MLNDGNNQVSIEKSFRIKQDDGFFSRLMAKESSMGNTSSRVFYYGATSIAVPFMWEAQPGTPKHPSSETSLPPLTPPPSYYSNSMSGNKRTNSRANIFSRLLPRFVGSRKGHHVSPSSSRSSSSSSSSSWSLVYPAYSYSLRDKDQGSLSSLSQSTTAPSFVKHKASKGSFRGCYPFRNIKNGSVRHGAV